MKFFKHISNNYKDRIPTFVCKEHSLNLHPPLINVIFNPFDLQTLAYYNEEIITGIIGFIVQAPENFKVLFNNDLLCER
jgi:hypothetical protein